MATITDKKFSSSFSAADKTNNPLKNFRSYSYHFILIATDTTAFIDASLSEDPQNPQKAAIVNSGDFFERKDRSNPRGVINHALGNYIILIDSRQDTDYIIDDVEWGTTFIGNSNSGNTSVALNTFLTDGQMKITEPYGIQFLNMISDIAAPTQLNTDPATMPFLLKVIFVGHADDGTVQTVYDVPPFGIIFTDMGGSVDANGSVYNLKYTGAANGAGWNQTYDSIVDGMSFDFVQGQNLDQHLQRFTAQINDKYKKDRTDFINNNFKDENIKAALNKTCMITWQLKALDGAKEFPKIRDFGIQTPDQVKVGGTGNAYSYKGSKEGGIAELINKLFATSTTWTSIQMGEDSDANEKNQTKDLFSFKVSPVFKKLSVDHGNSIQIDYWISEYQYTTVDVGDNNTGSGNAKPPKINPNNVYEFDYIFTGKNIDIVKMDMNLSLGFALWMSLVTSKALPSQLTDVNGSVTDAAAPQTRSVSGTLNAQNFIRTGTPIWPPALKTEGFTKEFSNQSKVASADAIWRNFAAYQAIQTDIVINGNPTLIQKIALPSTTNPNYVKINVKMPAKTTYKTDIWEYAKQRPSDNLSLDGYYEPFWFHGYYNIITAKNKFNGGEFTQELHLIAMPETDTSMSTGDITTADTSNQTSTAAPQPTQSAVQTKVSVDDTVITEASKRYASNN